MTKKQVKDLSFEQAMQEFESVVKELESGEGGLDGAIAKYEYGVELKTYLNKKLEQAKLKIDKIVDKDGKTELESFDV
jgi:exodeoxyribonuclease VII small subunit